MLKWSVSLNGEKDRSSIVLNARRKCASNTTQSVKPVKLSNGEAKFHQFACIIEAIGQLKMWIEFVTKEALPNHNHVIKCLHENRLLQKFITAIVGDSRTKKLQRILLWSESRHVAYFLKECKGFRLNSAELFQQADWNYVVTTPSSSFHDAQWLHSVRKILLTFYYLALKLRNSRKYRGFTENLKLSSFRTLSAEKVRPRTASVHDTKFECSTNSTKDFSCSHNFVQMKMNSTFYERDGLKKKVTFTENMARNFPVDPFRMSTKNLQPNRFEIMAAGANYIDNNNNNSFDDGPVEQISFSSYLKPKDNKRFKHLNSLNMSKKFTSLLTGLTNHHKVKGVTLNPSDEGYSTSSFNGKSNTLPALFPKPDRNNNTLLRSPSPDELEKLSTFLSELTKRTANDNRRDNRTADTKMKSRSLNALPNKDFHCNGVQWSAKSPVKRASLTSELKDAVNALLTVGSNHNTLVVRRSVGDDEEDTVFDSGIDDNMPGVVKEKRKSKRDKKEKGETDKRSTPPQQSENAYEVVRHRKKKGESMQRTHSESHATRKQKKNKDEKSKDVRSHGVASRAKTDERLDERVFRRSDSDCFVPRKNVSKTKVFMPSNNQNKSHSLSPAQGAALQRNNSLHIKASAKEYMWDTADGKHRVYVRSKADEAPPLPDKKEMLRSYDRDVKGWLRHSSGKPSDVVDNTLEVSPEILSLLKEEEKFWHKQQELKVWRESRDREVNQVNIVPPPQRTRNRHREPARRVNDRCLSESEREMEETLLEREAERLMKIRAEQVHVLQTSRENLLRENNAEKNRHSYPSRNTTANRHSYPSRNSTGYVSGNETYVNTNLTKRNVETVVRKGEERRMNWDPPASSRSSARAYLSPDSEPIYERSKTSVVNYIRNSRKTCFSDDEDFRERDNCKENNRGYFSDPDATQETFQARPMYKGKRVEIRCTSCRRKINDERLMTVESPSYNWHLSCFFCVVCRAYLNDRRAIRVRIVHYRLHCRFCYSSSKGDQLSEV